MRPVMENGFPVQCGECREWVRYEGNGRKQVKVCGCALPEKKPKTINTAAKGRRLERAERKKLEKLGVFKVRQQPGSGAFGTREGVTDLQGDNAFVIAGKPFKQECKSRADDNGFKVIKTWIKGCHVLTIKQDREPPIHVLTDEAWLHLVGAANGGTNE